jgi:hypothetical protein
MGNEMDLNDSAIARFLTYIEVREENECWPWRSAEIDGYGVLRVAGRNIKATHIALWLERGETANGRIACHSCDNPPCCNPKHIWFGTIKQNAEDSVAKGRQTKFTEEMRAVVSKRMKGVSKTEDHRSKIGEGNKRRRELYQRVVKQFAFGYGAA